MAEPLSDNVVLKLDRDGNVVGVEILTLRKLDSEDLEKLPRKRQEHPKGNTEKLR